MLEVPVVDFGTSILRVCNTKGERMGTGFVVSESLAVTCAHVVTASGAVPGGHVCIVFHANSERCEAEVLPDFWRPQEADDIAVLRLLVEGDLLPDGVEPAKLGSTHACKGHGMEIVGFAQPAGYEYDRVLGKILGLVPHRSKQAMLRLDSKQHLPAREEAEEKGIRVGMSGAPVFDLNTQRVVGMYSEFCGDTPLEWATTAETLQAVCPALPLHPPQAVDNYLVAVLEYCANLPYLTLHDIHPPKTLAEVYIPLKVSPQPPREYKQVDEAERAHRVMDLSEVSPIAEVMRSCEHLLILGAPGSGKSTLLRQMAESAWEAPEKIGLDAPHLPVLVSLQRLASADGSVEERINRALTSDLMLIEELPDGFFTDWPEQTGARWLILLDALENVPESGWARVIPWLNAFSTNVGHNRIVITTRPSANDRLFNGNLFGVYHLVPFTSEQSHDFARKWCSDQAEHFLEQFNQVLAGELSGTPLLLTIAAKIFLEKGRLPKRRCVLYEQFVDIWLNEAEQRELKGELGAHICKVAKSTLARLALAITEQPHQTSEKSLSQVGASYLRKALRLSNDEAAVDGRKFVQVMVRRSGVFIRRGDVYDFIHATFREYLAATAVVQECDGDSLKVWERVISRWEEEGWREVALFALGMLIEEGQEVSTLFERIWKKDRIWKSIWNYGIWKWIWNKTIRIWVWNEGVRQGWAIGGDARRLGFMTEGLMEQVRIWIEAARPGLIERVRIWIEGARPGSGKMDDLRRVIFITTALRTEIGVGEDLGNRIINILLACIRKRGISVAGHVAFDYLQYEAPVNPCAANALLALARDAKGNPVDCMLAAQALLKYGRRDDLVVMLLRDAKANAIVRVGSTLLLGELKGRHEAIPILRSLGHDEKLDAKARVGAAWALAKFGEHVEEGTTILLALALKSKIGALGDAPNALGELGRTDDLLTLVREPKIDRWVREQAILAMGNYLSDDYVLPDLEQLVNDPDPDTRDATYWAIRRIQEMTNDRKQFKYEKRRLVARRSKWWNATKLRRWQTGSDSDDMFVGALGTRDILALRARMGETVGTLDIAL